MQSKKVAIIGAGPSGLVTANTLLHNFPQGTFSPVIFDSRHEVGGLWSDHQSGANKWKSNTAPNLDPSMRTNLSRFTVSFSDLSWESVLGTSNVPMFPQARQVGQYLAAYRKRYIPDSVMRLGHRVLKAERIAGKSTRWAISWIRERSEQVNAEYSSKEDRAEVEEFDLLVVASGYFARPYIPTIPGLDQFTDRVFHSSEIQKLQTPPNGQHPLAQGDVAVIGGSISGAESASTVALHQSSYLHNSNTATQIQKKPRVHHIYARPFWNLPTYLPYETPEERVSFLPLDLVMYDLGRRPTGPVEYALGTIPEEKATKTNEYFSSLLGADYNTVGYLCDRFESQSTHSRPAWVAIGNDYAEFVRSGAIESTMGRAVSASNHDTGLTNIKIDTTDGQSKTLKNITAVVMATGFTPFEALSFLPKDILSTLEYSTDDPFLPLILDKGGTIRSEVPDLGFVGFYRGPYWGVMEMQARFLGAEWTKQGAEISTTEQVESVRVLRHPNSHSQRGQFPMGDYVGLMEMFARDLGIARTELSTESRSGPVVPARYVYNPVSSMLQNDMEKESRRTLAALKAMSGGDPSVQAAPAALVVFRALHGKWKFHGMKQDTSEEETGTLEFSPRYPSNAAYDREYVCEESLASSSMNRSVFRLSESMSSEVDPNIQIWPEDTLEIKGSDRIKNLLLTSFQRKKREGKYVPGEYVINARISPANGPKDHSTAEHDPQSQYDYTFHFEGVSIVSWEKFYPGPGCSGSRGICE